jgi:Carboxypeptidase regulatory-like domain
MLHRAIPVIAVALALSIAAIAQFELGSVVGTVKDPAGLAMPNTVVEIKSLATNVTRKTVTSAAGDFDFVALQPGRYAPRRNILFGPGTAQFDLSLFKDFAFNESKGRRVEFRAEAFNVLNTPQFTRRLVTPQPRRLPARALRCSSSAHPGRFSSL